jgi:hypothetical protein
MMEFTDDEMEEKEELSDELRASLKQKKSLHWRSKSPSCT